MLHLRRNLLRVRGFRTLSENAHAQNFHYTPYLPTIRGNVYCFLLIFVGRKAMEIFMEEKRIALIGIIVEKYKSAELVNAILHEYGEFIIGRMGIPHKERGICIISIALDAPNNIISALSGKLGMIEGVSTKTIYQKTSIKQDN